MKTIKLILVFASIAMFAACSKDNTTRPQGTGYNLSGQLYNDMGRQFIDSGQIVLTNLNTGVKYTVMAGTGGRFSFSGLAAASYSLYAYWGSHDSPTKVISLISDTANISLMIRI